MADPIGAAKDTITVIGEVIRISGDNPNVRAAGGELGKTALTITKTINNALLPLAAINFAFDKARDYFSTRFNSELSEKLRDVPPEHVVEPKASIAGPALQGLAFSHEEVDLKELYLSLLASAMDGRSSISVHPAFVEIVRQLTAEEASLLRHALRVEGSIEIVEVRAILKQTGWQMLHRHLLSANDSTTGKPVENQRIPAIVDNWIRLGLVTVEYDKHLIGDNAYAWVEARPEVVRLRAQHQTADAQVTIQKGILTRTALGHQFAIVVGVLDAHRTSA